MALGSAAAASRAAGASTAIMKLCIETGLRGEVEADVDKQCDYGTTEF
jgi:hypothetical protein